MTKTKAKKRGPVKVRRQAPLFVNKTELSHHYTVDPATIDRMVRDGEIPPPHSRPSERLTLWLREHFDAFVAAGRWPEEAFKGRAGE